ncbi:hypothetical protein [Tunturiibacter gelidiferens]|uniref:hypothetical protein n=1 Tax=Tunturiibacter gelidiferens TaxID=3069689 RepID=UPI003D9BE510
MLELAEFLGKLRCCHNSPGLRLVHGGVRVDGPVTGVLLPEENKVPLCLRSELLRADPLRVAVIDEKRFTIPIEERLPQEVAAIRRYVGQEPVVSRKQNLRPVVTQRRLDCAGPARLGRNGGSSSPSFSGSGHPSGLAGSSYGQMLAGPACFSVRVSESMDPT